MFRYGLSLTLLFCSAAVAATQPIVTEVMYDPASSDAGWEWIEVFNPGATPVDLDGYFVDRVGDPRQNLAGQPQIRSAVLVDGSFVINDTEIPAGGVAVLYNGGGLGWDPQRFRDAWPQTPASTPLIGVDGWTSNALSNTPAPPSVDESLPGLTVGFWPTLLDYFNDTADVSESGDTDNRVVGVGSAAFSFSYDDLPPWPAPDGESSIAYRGAGSLGDGASWALSDAGVDSAYESTATFLQVPINGEDYGSPGAIPGGPTPSSLVITEIMYNPESATGTNEWEWVEVFNGGPPIDFATRPFWLDDDDGSPMAAPNVDAGQIPSGGVAVLFNASAIDLASMQEAWGNTINFIAVEDWSALNNTGDVVGLWDDAADYLADFGLGESVAGAVTGTVYDDSSPWPTDDGTDSIWLRGPTLDVLSGSSWGIALGASSDPNVAVASPVLAPGGVADNSGEDVGSPGLFAAAAGLPGDFNDDGRVDAGDYTLWRSGGPLLNETVSPGVADQLDYAVWSSNFGAGGAAAAVPEPGSVLGTLSGLFSGAWFRRARGRL